MNIENLAAETYLFNLILCAKKQNLGKILGGSEPSEPSVQIIGGAQA
jgi:hypothetical protein